MASGTPVSGSYRILSALGVAAVAMSAALCPGPSLTPDISRERAIEIARSQVSFEPDSIEAVAVTSGSRTLWRVTLRGRLPGQPLGLFETAIVEIDGRTGQVVSLGRT